MGRLQGREVEESTRGDVTCKYSEERVSCGVIRERERGCSWGTVLRLYSWIRGGDGSQPARLSGRLFGRLLRWLVSGLRGGFGSHSGGVGGSGRSCCLGMFAQESHATAVEIVHNGEPISDQQGL